MITARELISQTPADTAALGRRLGEELRPGHVVGLVGPLGAGKTCLVQGVALGLGVDPGAYVSSPTFTLVNEYQGRLPLYHVDLYRLSEPEELEEIGLDHYYRGDGACLVEWFERFPEDLPPSYLRVEIAVEEDLTRRFSVQAVGSNHLELAARWTGK